MYRVALLFLLILLAVPFLNSCGDGGSNENADAFSTSVAADTADNDIGHVAPLDYDKVVTDPETGMRLVSNQLLVVFKPDIERETVDTIIESVDGKVVGWLTDMGIYQVEFNNNPTLEELARIKTKLESFSEVESVTFNTLASSNLTPDPGNDPEWFKDSSSTDGWNENAPAGRNWGLEAIHAPSAWDYNKPASSIVIGVVDGGFNTTHEDLRDSLITTHSRRIPGPLTKEQAEELEQLENHGTHVAGTLGAVSNNNKGITGIIWQEHSMVAYQTDLQRADILYGIRWVIEKGARIINLSLGYHIDSKLLKKRGKLPYDEFEKTILEPKLGDLLRSTSVLFSTFMERLKREGKDFLIIQSAGNDRVDAKWNRYFCYINDQELRDSIIVVGAIDKDFKRAIYSNFGPRVDVYAPGANIFSTIYHEPYYGFMNGTSMAAPHVTGVAGLVLAQQPTLSAYQIKEIIIQSATSRNGLKIPDAQKAVELAQATVGNNTPTRKAIIKGTVTNIEGHPLEGVSIVAALQNGDIIASDRSKPVVGTYELHVPLDKILEIRASKEGYRVHIFKVDTSEYSTPIIADFQLTLQETKEESPSAPTIIGPSKAVSDKPFTLTINRGTDPDGDNVSVICSAPGSSEEHFSIYPGPGGSQAKKTITYGTVGTKSIACWSMDEKGNRSRTTKYTIKITYSGVPPSAPKLDAPANGTAGKAITIYITRGKDPDGDKVGVYCEAPGAKPRSSFRLDYASSGTAQKISLAYDTVGKKKLTCYSTYLSEDKSEKRGYSTEVYINIKQDTGYCKKYAARAISQQKDNINSNCGFMGDKWHDDESSHFNWCMSVDKSASRADESFRDGELSRCKSRNLARARCNSYASRAVSQQKENLKNNCGFSGDKWHEDRASHFDWCMSVPKATSDADSQFRASKLKSCKNNLSTKKKESHCKSYASAAISQQHKNTTNGCGFTGDKWHEDYASHFDWCMSVPMATSDADGQYRTLKLRECIKGGGQLSSQQRHCRNYANSAVSQQHENLSRHCGFTGDRWLGSFDAHFNWCMTVSISRSSSETSIRQDMLRNECGS